MKKCLLGVLAIGLLLAADDKKPDDVKGKLKGVWNVVSMEVNGMKLPDDAVKGQTLTFDGDMITAQKDKKEPATFKIDAAKKPAQLDLTPTEGKEKGLTIKMIFLLDGDTLKLAMPIDPKADRPKGFDGKEIGIMTLKREKK